MAVLVLFLGIGFFTLNVIAIYKVITKAGYSGNWILLVLAPFVAYLIGLVVLVSDVRSRNFHAGSFAGWFGLAGFLAFVEYIFFLVFAFSDWPALGPQGRGYPPTYGGYSPPGVPPFPGTPPGMPPAGARSQAPARGPYVSPARRAGWQGPGWSDPWGSRHDPPASPRPPQTAVVDTPDGGAEPSP